MLPATIIVVHTDGDSEQIGVSRHLDITPNSDGTFTVDCDGYIAVAKRVYSPVSFE